MDESGLSDNPGVAAPFPEESVRRGLALAFGKHWNKKRTYDDENSRSRTRDARERIRAGFIAVAAAVLPLPPQAHVSVDERHSRENDRWESAESVDSHAFNNN